MVARTDTLLQHTSWPRISAAVTSRSKAPTAKPTSSQLRPRALSTPVSHAIEDWQRFWWWVSSESAVVGTRLWRGQEAVKNLYSPDQKNIGSSSGPVFFISKKAGRCAYRRYARYRASLGLTRLKGAHLCPLNQQQLLRGRHRTGHPLLRFILIVVTAIAALKA